jgi:hypothetical protein
MSDALIYRWRDQALKGIEGAFNDNRKTEAGVLWHTNAQ